MTVWVWTLNYNLQWPHQTDTMHVSKILIEQNKATTTKIDWSLKGKDDLLIVNWPKFYVVGIVFIIS